MQDWPSLFASFSDPEVMRVCQGQKVELLFNYTEMDREMRCCLLNVRKNPLQTPIARICFMKCSKSHKCEFVYLQHFNGYFSFVTINNYLKLEWTHDIYRFSMEGVECERNRGKSLVQAYKFYCHGEFMPCFIRNLIFILIFF